MSSSKIVTRNDLRDVLNEIVPIMETSIVNEAEDIVETVAPDIVEDYVSSSAFTSAILDVFYPVGCYFETSDTTFNPNISWGGTWVLETEGQVHVSAGSSWPVAGAANNTSDGGEQNHTLTVNEMPSHNHGSYYTGAVSGTKRYGWFNVSGTNIDYGAINTGGGQAHNNMPPYIVVNRWHRTA